MGTPFFDLHLQIELMEDLNSVIIINIIIIYIIYVIIIHVYYCNHNSIKICNNGVRECELN